MTKKSRWSFPSARKDRQKYTSDDYRSRYTKIKWNKNKKKGKEKN